MSIITFEQPFTVGKYLVSPLSRRTETGDYLASISLRSGNGVGTRDRVFRLLPRFDSHQEALIHAAQVGRGLASPQALA